MSPEFVGAMLAFYGGCLVVLAGLYTMIRLGGIAPIFLIAGYLLSCHVAWMLAPQIPVEANFTGWTLKAIHWAHAWSALIGAVVIGISGFYIFIALSSGRHVGVWRSTVPASIPANDAQWNWAYAFIGLIAVAALFVFIRWGVGSSGPKTPLTELALTAQRYEQKTNVKLYARERPFHLRVPDEFLKPELRQIEYKKLAVEWFDKLKGGSKQKLVVKHVIGVRLKSSDNLRIDVVIIEFEGKIGTIVGKKKVKQPVDVGGGKMVEQEVDADDVQFDEVTSGISIPADMSQEKTTALANQLRTWFENRLDELETVPNATPTEPKADGRPKLGELPDLIPTLDSIPKK